MLLDRLYTNGNVITLDDSCPRATGFAVLGDRIVAVGDRDDLEGITARSTVDLDGATVVPGFNDAHNHTLRLGMMLNELLLESPPIRSLGDIFDAIGKRAAEQPPGSWIIGCRYDQNKLAEGRHPTAVELQRAAPNHHVWLKHTSLHMAVVSQSVLELVEIDEVPVPTGGWVERDSTGRATGLLLENAQEIVSKLAFPHPVEEVARAIGLAHAQYASEGLTSCQEAGIGGGIAATTPQDLAAFVHARREGRLLARTVLMVAADALHELDSHTSDLMDWGLDLGISSGFGDEMLRLGAVKIWADGSLVGRTAAMDDAFTDDHDNCGQLLYDPERLFDLVRRAHRGGWQIATHAIGDRAVSTVLDMYEKVLAETPRDDHRHRIEHCAITTAVDVERIHRLGVIPVPQGRFVNELGDGMASALGEDRLAQCYRQHTFIERGIRVPGSSDRPVVNGAPLLGIADMVLRTTPSGRVIGPEERVSAEQALRAWTVDAAYASFEDDLKGRIKPGLLADATVLSADILAIDPTEIPAVQVLATIRGGQTTFEA